MRTVLRWTERHVQPLMGAVRDGLGYLVFERRTGLETRGEVGWHELELSDPSHLRYKPMPWLALNRILRKREVGPNDVFVDFGSGKGRVLLRAARYPFKRVIGVEISETLNRIARENVGRNRPRMQCREVQVLTSDAVDWPIPDDLTVAFFYNPFLGEVFALVIERLIQSVDSCPRRLRIIYANPKDHEKLLETGRLRLVRKRRGLRPTRRWSRAESLYMYEVVPRTGLGTAHLTRAEAAP